MLLKLFQSISVLVNVPLLQINPSSGLNSGIAFTQRAESIIQTFGITRMLDNLKFRHDCSLAQVIITASRCVSFSKPTLYQHGSEANEPSPGCISLMMPVKFVHVKSFPVCCLFWVLAGPLCLFGLSTYSIPLVGHSG